MAIFGTKNKKVESKKEVAVVAKDKMPAVSYRSVLLKPRITEKAGVLSEKNVYTFVVSDKATKGTVSKAIKETYKVSPVQVNIINLPKKRIFVRGRYATKSGVKKALVFLKEGDKIEFV
jgi:large subunit ribosomal protein L23